ncbi:hypothetical protein L208DRAFT_1383262 [Tricholoma matsutake]|nr:hypothetical protein L208DRAFT_1383262 [Tricholoma matsutake 945]
MKKDTTWTKKNCVGLHAKVAKEVWEKADEETKEAVHAKIVAIIADKQKASNAWDTCGAKQFHDAIKECPQHILPFFKKLAEETGWAFIVLMRGPNPEKPDSEISTCSFHVGVTSLGHKLKFTPSLTNQLWARIWNFSIACTVRLYS